ncbi:hypothetical protein BT67DRAFT_93425 [Trichocladium antarcticum]|uniref:Uncharacterized protein n=1 Tax=Trichocladium antarcticum TaxID=1450529 RepID=A0AAN6UFR1_9PEZI|nr:hypothetical protein BT67DRAFT_93425 [Trichocladium antarcticum]
MAAGSRGSVPGLQKPLNPIHSSIEMLDRDQKSARAIAQRFLLFGMGPETHLLHTSKPVGQANIIAARSSKQEYPYNVSEFHLFRRSPGLPSNIALSISHCHAKVQNEFLAFSNVGGQRARGVGLAGRLLGPHVYLLHSGRFTKLLTSGPSSTWNWPAAVYDSRNAVPGTFPGIV